MNAFSTRALARSITAPIIHFSNARSASTRLKQSSYLTMRHIDVYSVRATVSTVKHSMVSPGLMSWLV